MMNGESSGCTEVEEDKPCLRPKHATQSAGVAALKPQQSSVDQMNA